MTIQKLYNTNKQYNITNFSKGIVSDVADDSQIQGAAEDILNFVPGKQGELKKIPIGMYLGTLSATISKVIHHPAP